MKTFIPLFLLFIILTGTSCQKPIQETKAEEFSFGSPVKLPGNDTSILVDASKDGGVWWFPQSPETGFSETNDHQGQVLANYLRSLGFHVDELPRGAVITNELLEKYSRIIRGPAFFDYTDNEIAAYKSFLNRPGAILLLQDHLSYTTNDKLSELLGVTFKGAVEGSIASFTPHEITSGVTDLPYIAGAVATNTSDNPNILVLGSLTNYNVMNGSDPFNGESIAAPVMGLVTNFPNTKICFLGDANAIEWVPQPLTHNIVSWLFQ